MHSEFAIAIHSLVFLAHTPNRLRTSDSIANSIVIHPVRVRKVLAQLRKRGYIQSKEGAKGGFYLNKDPKFIHLDELYAIFTEDSVVPKWPEVNPRCPVGSHIEESMESIFETVEQGVKEHFHQYTIADVLNRIQEKV
ncbi:Rrf2 family transcriptional regulator [Alicyclobacillus sp. SO9]|uniref:RrF2 family transcriptional regulator n=1 Tax=Alicyclobacillus sp. SO9 TaxID=2665646 RepID=UPI0018E907D4|nr:Rrf2 family transcriptional regulator [Alicyclobacillus sp. SO9]QQE79241.1 Rrf2 family transcriptional regulator [Alicyclobacillus sp. SO9]